MLIVNAEIDIRLLVARSSRPRTLTSRWSERRQTDSTAPAVFNTLDPPDIPRRGDLRQPDARKDGLDVASEMLTQEPRQQIVLFSAFVSGEIEYQAALGVRACVGKHDFDLLPELVVLLSR